MAADPVVSATQATEDELPVCRICLSSDEDGSRLIAPCRCTGTMKYVHRDCLRTWRTQGSAAAADVCPVCNSVYTSMWGTLPGRIFQRFPAASTALLGSAFLWACSPRLHRRLAEAVLIQTMAPLPIQWFAWELGPGIVPAIWSWLVNGCACLTVPALLDHLFTALRHFRLVEMILFSHSAKRFGFTLVLAAVRGSLESEEGLRTMLGVQEVVDDAIDAAAHDGVPHRKSVEDLLDLYFGAFKTGARQRCAGRDQALQRRCLQLRLLCPQHFFVYLKVLGAQLGCRSMLQRWLPLVWHFANQDVDYVALVVDLLAAFANFVFLDSSGGQMQQSCCNLRDILLSVRRGVRAVRIFTVYLS